MSGFNPKNIVVPYDLSTNSREAINEALATGVDAADIHVVHVIPKLNYSEQGLWHTIEDDVRIQHVTKAIRKSLSQDDYKDLCVDIIIGDPGYRIAEYAKHNSADMIVISSHGWTGLAHMLIGSVTEHVVRLSHYPVLVLRKYLIRAKFPIVLRSR